MNAQPQRPTTPAFDHPGPRLRVVEEAPAEPPAVQVPPGRRDPSVFFLASAAVLGLFTAVMSLVMMTPGGGRLSGIAAVGGVLTCAFLIIGLLRSVVTRPLHRRRFRLRRRRKASA